MSANDKKADTFTPGQLEFCRIRHDNPNISATACVHRAYPGKFKTDNAAASHASRMLRKGKIRRRLDELSRQLQARIGSTVGRIMLEEAVIAFYDPGELMDTNTRQYLPLDRIPKHLRRAIASLKVTVTQSLKDPELERTEYEYKFLDKGAALGRLERILGMNEKDWEQQRWIRENQKQETTVKDRWVLIPTDKPLTLKEWSEQVEELNRYQEEKAAKQLPESTGTVQ